MPRRAKIRARFSADIRKTSKRFRDHETMTSNKVLRWMMQFEDGDLDLAVKILHNIRYYSGKDIRKMMRNLVTLVYRSLHGVRKDRICFIPVGRPGGGGSILARALGDTPGVRRSQIKYMAELEALPAGDVGGIVFLDDFSGTGEALSEWWTNVEMLVRPKAAPLVVALLVVNYLARPRIEQFATTLIGVEGLAENHNVLSPVSEVFQAPEKETLLAYCRKTGCAERLCRGYGNCGLLVAFRHGCPNNSLPVLWHDSATWHSVFRRRAM